jgi:transcriptional pleiotropic repressor
MQLVTNTNTVVSQLSYTEYFAVGNLVKALQGETKKTLISGDLKKDETSRTSVVNALSKLEIAGVIRSKSLGMKGTYIEVLNQEALNEIAGV